MQEITDLTKTFREEEEKRQGSEEESKQLVSIHYEFFSQINLIEIEYV